MDAAFAEWVRVGLAFHVPFEYQGRIPFAIEQVMTTERGDRRPDDFVEVVLFCQDLEMKKCFAIAFAKSLDPPPDGVHTDIADPDLEGLPAAGSGTIWMNLDNVTIDYDPFDRVDTSEAQ